MKSFFQDSNTITSLVVSGFDTKKVQNMAKMFSGVNRVQTLNVSKFPIFLSYSLAVNCQSLNTLKIDFIKDENEDKNQKNIEILNEMCPKLITYLKTLNTFSLTLFGVILRAYPS